MAQLDSTTKSSHLEKLSNFPKLQISALQLTDYKKMVELQQNNDVQQ